MRSLSRKKRTRKCADCAWLTLFDGGSPIYVPTDFRRNGRTKVAHDSSHPTCWMDVADLNIEIQDYFTEHGGPESDRRDIAGGIRFMRISRPSDILAIITAPRECDAFKRSRRRKPPTEISECWEFHWTAIGKVSVAVAGLVIAAAALAKGS